MATNYFTRILDKEQIRKCVKMLEEAADRKFPVDLSKEMFEIRAPDGDVVFSGAMISPGMFACRHHKEVFEEN